MPTPIRKKGRPTKTHAHYIAGENERPKWIRGSRPKSPKKKGEISDTGTNYPRMPKKKRGKR